MIAQRKKTKIDVSDVYRKEGAGLRAFIRSRVPSANDTNDLLQDVFLQLQRTISAAQSPIENVTGWLYQVARNLSTNHLKRRREEFLPIVYGSDGEEKALADISEILWNETSSDPECEYLRSLFWAELKKALENLPPEQRDAFVLTELDGLPAREVADAMDIPLATLLSRKHYAVMRLRKHLEEIYQAIMQA